MVALSSLFVKVAMPLVGLDRDIARAQQKVRAVDRMKATPKITLPATLQADFAGLTAKLNQLNRQRVNLNVNSTTATADIRTLQGQLERLQRTKHAVPVEMRGKVDAQIKEVERELAAASRKQTTLPLRLERVDSRIDAVKRQLHTLESPIQIPVDTDRLTRTGRTGGRKLSSALSGAAMAGVAGLGATLGIGVTAGLAGALRSIVTIGNQYSVAVNTFGAVTNATTAEMGRMRDQAILLGKDIHLPGVSAAGAADAMTELAKAGLSVTDSIGAARGVLALSRAAMIGEGDAAGIAAAALNAFHINASQTSVVADQLAATANASAVEITDVSDSMKMAAAVFSTFQRPVLGSVGALTELNTAIGILGNVGMRGSDVGTSLKQALLQLANPTGRASTLMKVMAIRSRGGAMSMTDLKNAVTGHGDAQAQASARIAEANRGLLKQGNLAYDARGKMKPLHVVVQDLAKATKGMTDEQRNAAVAQIFGADATRTILALMEQGPKAWDNMSKAVQRQGAATDVAAAKNKGLSGAMDNLQSTLETVGISIYELIAPALTSIVNLATRGVDAIGGFVNKIKPALQGLRSVIAGGDFTGNLTKAFGITEDDAPTGVLLKLGATVRDLAGKFRAYFEGVIIPIARDVFAYFVREWPKIRPTVIGIFSSLGQIVTTTMSIIGKVISSATTILGGIWSRWGGQITAVVGGAFQTVIAVVGGALKIIGGVLEALNGLILGDNEQLKAGLGRIWDGIKQIAVGIFTNILNVIDATVGGIIKRVIAAVFSFATRIATTVSNLMASVAQFFVDGFNAVRTAVSTALAAVGSTVSAAFGAVVGFVSHNLQVIVGVVSFLLKPLVTLFKVVFTAITTIVILSLGAVQKAAQIVWGLIYNKIIGPALAGITRLFTRFSTAVQLAWAQLWDRVTATVSTAWSFVYVKIISPIWSRISRLFATAQTAVRLAWAAFWGAVRDRANAIFSYIRDRIVTPIWNRVTAIFSAAQSAVRAAWSTFWGAIRDRASAVFAYIRDRIISPAWSRISGIFTSSQTGVRNRWRTFWDGIKATGRDAIDWVRRHIDTVLGKIKDAFSLAKANIKTVWSGVRSVVSAPINWIKDNVYNRPLVPVWNRVAGLVNGPRLKAYALGGIAEAERYANGGTPYGVRPGYTPGRDTHQIGVSGGEAIMRPEWTKAAGADYVNSANAAARAGGVKGARDYIAKNGLPGMSPADGGLSPVDGYAGGGIIGWLRNTISRAGAAIGNIGAKVKDWVLGGLRTAAGKLLDPVKSAIRRNMPNSGVGRTVGGIGVKAVNLVLNKIKSSDEAAAPAAGAPGSGTAPSNLAGQGRGMLAAARAGRALGASYVAFHRDPSGYPSYDMGSSIPVGNRIVGHLLAHRGDYGVRYIIHNMRIWSARNWGGRLYHPITNAGDFRHVAHVHSSYYRNGGIVPLQDGGVVKGGRGGVLASVGEGRRDELVTPLPPGWKTRTDDLSQEVRHLIRAIEENGLRGTTVQFGDVLVPRGEPVSLTINRELQRAANMGLVK